LTGERRRYRGTPVRRRRDRDAREGRAEFRLGYGSVGDRLAQRRAEQDPLVAVVHPDFAAGVERLVDRGGVGEIERHYDQLTFLDLHVLG